MIIFSKFFIQLSFFLVFSSISISLIAADKLPTQLPVFIDHPTDPDTVIIDYQRDHPMLAEKKGAGSIKVYGDGRVVIYFPEYMKKSGTYEIYLDETEIQALLQRLTNPRQPHASEQAKHGNAKIITQMSSDHSSSKLNLNLRTIISEISNEAAVNSQIKVPSISTPRLNSAAEKSLIEILERKDMIPLNRLQNSQHEK
jgi:hypothetical protein